MTRPFHHPPHCTCISCTIEDDRRANMTAIAVLVLLAALLLAVSACTPAQRSSVAPLGDVVRRVDVTRLLECAAEKGIGRALCLGAAVLTPALDVAVERAVDLAERAQQALTPGAGAGDVDPEALAIELDAALAQVGREIEAAR